MSQWNELSAPQTDADTPGHKLPDASDNIPQGVRPIIASHSRQVVPPLRPAMQGEYDQDVCICITCHTRCQNNDALRKHGKTGDHHPYGCVCGNTFARLDVLERHIASKNKVAKFLCPLCNHDQVLKTFSRADHLPQHLRTFHKIPGGKIPEDFAASLAHDGPAAEDKMSFQPIPSFPCLMPGCMRTGELAYFRQIDLDEHTLLMHGTIRDDMHVQQGLDQLFPTWMNGFQQNVYPQPSQIFQQDTQQNGFPQLNPAGDFQTNAGFRGDDMFAGNQNFQLDDEFNFDFGLDFNFDV
ncbi:hypothetical protein HD806DRAFT_524623 [Xylariaceae sp. AK1471]|nr:hypothetical protein HD806DRAFT_524623 [Xylariaceae sp. AK1471]